MLIQHPSYRYPFLAFVAILGVVFYIVDTQGSDNIRLKSEKLIIQICPIKYLSVH